DAGGLELADYDVLRLGFVADGREPVHARTSHLLRSGKPVKVRDMDGFVVEEPRARRIELPERGGAMAALDFGPADRPIDIVFSHANGFNARTYRTVLADLAPRFRILAVDLRGHGRTALPTETEGRNSWDGLADDLLALMAALDVR